MRLFRHPLRRPVAVAALLDAPPAINLKRVTVGLVEDREIPVLVSRGERFSTSSRFSQSRDTITKSCRSQGF